LETEHLKSINPLSRRGVEGGKARLMTPLFRVLVCMADTMSRMARDGMSMINNSYIRDLTAQYEEELRVGLSDESVDTEELRVEHLQKLYEIISDIRDIVTDGPRGFRGVRPNVFGSNKDIIKKFIWLRKYARLVGYKF
jgi:hypothetical protein